MVKSAGTKHGVPRLRHGWEIEPVLPGNLDYCLVRAGIADVVLDACRRWRNELVSGGRLLDVGCGSQPYRPWIEHAGLSYTGIDWPESIHDQEPLDVVQWDLRMTPWPFPDGAFDSLLCTEVLEHIPEPAALLAECARVCRAGALMLLTTPLVWPEHERPHDYFRFTQQGLKYLLHTASFSIEETVARGGWNAALGQLIGFWACHAFGERWNGMTRLLTWPAVAMLARLDRLFKTPPELPLTLGYAVFARRVPNSTSFQNTLSG